MFEQKTKACVGSTKPGCSRSFQTWSNFWLKGIVVPSWSAMGFGKGSNIVVPVSELRKRFWISRSSGGFGLRAAKGSHALYRIWV